MCTGVCNIWTIYIIIAVSFSTKNCSLETSPGLRLFLLTGLLVPKEQWHSLLSSSITVAGPPGNHTPFRFFSRSSMCMVSVELLLVKAAQGKLLSASCFLLRPLHILNITPQKERSMPGRFIITKTQKGFYRFSLQAANYQTVLTSKNYSSLATCREGVETIKKNALSR